MTNTQPLFPVINKPDIIASMHTKHQGEPTSKQLTLIIDRNKALK